MVSTNSLVLDDVVIRKVTSLNEPKLEEIIDVYIETYWDDIYRGPIVRKENKCGRYMAGGMYRTAIMNGFALVAEDKESGKVLGGSGFIGPGKERIFGSEEQMKLSGYKTMHELLTEEENKLWDEQTDIWFSLIDKAALSPLDHGFSIMQLFVSPKVQKRGIGTKLIKESMKALAASNDLDAFLILCAYTPKSTRLYEHLGFKVTASTEEMPLESKKADGSPRKFMRAVVMTMPESGISKEDLET